MTVTVKLPAFTLQSLYILRRLLTARLFTLPTTTAIQASRLNMMKASPHIPRVNPRIIQHLATTLRVIPRATPLIIPPPAINPRVILLITPPPATIPQLIPLIIQHPATAKPIQARPP